MKLIKGSSYFTDDEMERSQTAERHGLDNRIPDKVMPNIIRLVTTVLDPLRKLLKKPLIVTSGYRSPILNTLIGGVKNSDHTKGLAADIYVKDFTIRGLVMFIIKAELPYEKVIDEFGSWVHIAIPEDPEATPKRQNFRAVKNPGEHVQYLPFQIK